MGAYTQVLGSADVPEVPSSGGVEVLLAMDETAARLTLEALLEKSGYLVDSAASSAEAMAKLEEAQYALVLCNLQGESVDASRNVVRLAQTQHYRPATAYLTAFQEHSGEPDVGDEVLIEPVNIPAFLTQVTELLASRAAGRAARRARL